MRLLIAMIPIKDRPTLRRGSQGEMVRELQSTLRTQGFACPVSGFFCQSTELAVRNFQRAAGIVVDGIVGGQTWEALIMGVKSWPDKMPANVGKFRIIQSPLTRGSWFESFQRKTQIVLHHTASSGEPGPVINWFNTSPNRIATAFVIGGFGRSDGQIHQLFDDREWAFHVGTNGQIDPISIGIELCNWGHLRPSGSSSFLTYTRATVPDSQVVDLGREWRGFRYFHAYTPLQLEAMAELVRHLAKRWGIPIQNNFDLSWFEINQSAREGQAGVWNHSNYRSDKTDLSPQPALIKILNQLKSSL